MTASNLLDMLDNGVVLCHLAKVIQERAQDAVHGGIAKGVSINTQMLSLCILLTFLCFHFLNPSIGSRLYTW